MARPLAPTSDRDRLIAEHMSLPVQIATLAREGCYDDAKADGYAALVAAADRFDPTRGVSFTTYAWHRIRGAMKDGHRRKGRRRPSLAPRAQDAEQGDNTEHRDPIFEPYDDDDDTVGPADHADGAAPEESIDRRRTLARLRQHLSALPEREQKIALSYYFVGKTLQEAAEEIGYSEGETSRIHSRMLRQLRQALSTTENP